MSRLWPTLNEMSSDRIDRLRKEGQMLRNTPSQRDAFLYQPQQAQAPQAPVPAPQPNPIGLLTNMPEEAELARQQGNPATLIQDTPRQTGGFGVMDDMMKFGQFLDQKGVSPERKKVMLEQYGKIALEKLKQAGQKNPLVPGEGGVYTRPGEGDPVYNAPKEITPTVRKDLLELFGEYEGAKPNGRKLIDKTFDTYGLSIKKKTEATEPNMLMKNFMGKTEKGTKTSYSIEPKGQGEESASQDPESIRQAFRNGTITRQEALKQLRATGNFK